MPKKGDNNLGSPRSLYKTGRSLTAPLLLVIILFHSGIERTTHKGVYRLASFFCMPFYGVLEIVTDKHGDAVICFLGDEPLGLGRDSHLSHLSTCIIT